jgi:hypothetical protein
MQKKTYTYIAGICFIIILAGTFIANALISDKKYSAAENRNLQEFPELTVTHYLDGRFEKSFEDYANDQFMFRGAFVKIKTSADISRGEVYANGVYKGKDGYLIEDIVAPDKSLLDMDAEALASFRERYPELNMYFLLAPTAGNIMEDKLPATVKLADQDRYIDSFYGMIDKLGYTTIDVRQGFEEVSDDKPLYYKTDHHWNSRGAYRAYRLAAKTLGITRPTDYDPYVVKNDFNGSLYSKSGFTNGESDAIMIYLPKNTDTYKESVIYYSDTKEKTTEFYQLDNLDKKDAYTVFGGSNHPVYTIKTPVASTRRILVVKDSYANSFIPFLSQHFREIIVVDPRYYFENIDDLIATEGVTDVLFLYNANTFFADDSMAMMIK